MVWKSSIWSDERSKLERDHSMADWPSAEQELVPGFRSKRKLEIPSSSSPRFGEALLMRLIMINMKILELNKCANL